MSNDIQRLKKLAGLQLNENSRNMQDALKNYLSKEDRAPGLRIVADHRELSKISSDFMDKLWRQTWAGMQNGTIKIPFVYLRNEVNKNWIPTVEKFIKNKTGKSLEQNGYTQEEIDEMNMEMQQAVHSLLKGRMQGFF